MALPYKVIVYINGVRFEPAAVGYFANAGEHASFSVVMPAVPEWDVLPPRSHCAVFFTDPVHNVWRLLCEGEYIGYTKAKSAVGSRQRTLQFRTVHAVWQSTLYCGMVGLEPGQNAVSDTTRMLASGKEVSVSSSNTQSASLFDLARTDLIAYIKRTSNNTTLLTTFLPSFIRDVMQNTPVDAFYNAARRFNSKMFALADTEIKSVVDAELMLALLRDSWKPQNLSMQTPLEDIIRAIENMVMYQHLPIPAPPLYNVGGGKQIINELLFAPQLYTVVPPACNVIFRDQITEVQGSRNFLAEPTRVITQLEAPTEFGADLPAFYFSNDVERSVAVQGAKLDGSPDQTAKNAPAGVSVLHDMLTQEEYNIGVMPKIVNFSFKLLKPVTPELTNPGMTDEQKTKVTKDAEARFSLYISSACRHYYEVARGAARSMSVSCAFLPFVIPGLPCLVEDSSGSFWGVVQSVVHSLPAAGQPTTQLVVTHVREAYVTEGRLRNAFNPVWLNKEFLPGSINATYAKLFGNNEPNVGFVSGSRNTMSHAAMVPNDVISSVGKTNGLVPISAAEQVNMDELAAAVIPIPRYAHDGTILSAGSGEATIAERIRLSSNPQLAALQFQYRAGTTLSQFAAFHDLPLPRATPDATSGGSSADHPDYIFSTTPTPEDLSPGQPNELFGTPVHLVFKGKQAIDAGSPFGVYVSDTAAGQATVTDTRQNTARMIRDAIARRITEG